MRHRIVKDYNSGSYFIARKGHSFGSFKTWGAANAFVKQIEADDKAWRERQIEARAEIRRKIKEQDADRQAYLAAQRESDRLLYEGSST